MSPGRSRSGSLFPVGFASLMAGGGLLALIPVLFGAPQPIISIAFHDLDGPARSRLEQTFALTEAQQIGPDAWTYVPQDTTRTTLASLAAHPSVIATDGIDRRTSQISRHVPLTRRHNGLVSAPPAVSRATKALAYILVLLGMAACGAAAARRLAGWPPPTVLARDRWCLGWRAASRFLQRGVPVASPTAAGLIRIVLGSLVVWLAVSAPVRGLTIDPAEIGPSGLYGLLVRSAIQYPWSLALVDLAIVVCGALFVAGVATSLTFGCFVTAFLLWACVQTVEVSLHTTSVLSLALVGLLPARWGDGLGVDAWRRARAGGAAPQASRCYGYALWLPGFVFGVAFAAAAWSKVGSGIEWILNGTANYHFLADLDRAWVQWGPQLTSSRADAVMMSAAAVAIEALAITASFTMSVPYRVGVGAAIAVLLSGFALFQGVFWRAWWILLAGFLPWNRIATARDASPAEFSSVTRLQMVFVALIVSQQIVMSAFSMDVRPLLSTYDMYATTHRPEDDYDTPGPTVYRVVADTSDGWVSLPGCQLDRRDAERFRSTFGDVQIARSQLDQPLADCLARWPGVTRVRLDGDRQSYDWAAGRLVWKRRVDVVGPIRVDG